jgi:hypothetical protein
MAAGDFPGKQPSFPDLRRIAPEVGPQLPTDFLQPTLEFLITPGPEALFLKIADPRR